MALSPIEDSYLQRLTSSQFPDMPASEPAMPVDAAALDAPSMDGMQLAAGPSQTVSDAGPSIGPIPRNTFQTAVGKLGELIQSGADKIDFDVIGLPGIGSMTLKDLTVGDLGKVLQDMSYGFMPVRGGNVATGGIGTFGLKADPVMELLNAAPAVVSVAKGAVKAAKATKGMPVGMSTEAVDGIEKALTPKGAKLTPSVEVPAAGDITKPAFKKWFGDSKVTDSKGQPLVMYHGTTRNFESFDPNMSPSPDSRPIGAMFFTDDPKFAEDFARAPIVGTTGGNLIPVYVKASKPFDFDNKADRNLVIEMLMERVDIYRTAKDPNEMRRILDADIEKKDGTANWGTIEDPKFLQILKDLGYDSFYVREGGKKNLGVFDPSQVKSVFNKGTWNPNDKRILHGCVAAGTGAAATMQDKEQK